MKKFLTVILCVTATTAFCQQDSLLKIRFKVAAKCQCMIQFARQDTAVGKTKTLTSDHFNIAIDRGTSGFFIQCGKALITYIKFPKVPAHLALGIYFTSPCEEHKEGKISFDEFPNEKI